MVPNSRYRSILLYKLKYIPNILLATFDLSFIKNNSYKLSCIFHSIDKLNFINNILSKKFNIDIVENIIHFFINNNCKLIDLNTNQIFKLINNNDSSQINNYRFFVEIEEKKNKLDIFKDKFQAKKNIYTMNYLRNNLVKDTINLAVIEKFTSLLNSNINFDISDIFNLKNHPNFEICYFRNFR